MSGNVRNVLAHDCRFNGTDVGIRMKSNSSRGGIVENIWFRDITMKDIVREAITINTDYKAWMSSSDGKAHPVFRNLKFDNILCENAAVAARITGKQEQPIESISINNLSVKATKGLVFDWANDLVIEKLNASIKEGEPIRFSSCENIILENRKL